MSALSRRTVLGSLAARLSCAIALLLPLTASTVLRAQATTRTVRKADMALDCPACRDFFTYANGGWVKRTVIPADYPMYDGFMEAYDHNVASLHAILDGLTQRRSADLGPNERKLASYYGTCLDSAAADRHDAKPLAPLLQAIEGVQSRADLIRVIARLHAFGITAGFVVQPEIDPKASDRVIGQLYQGGLGLPDRDYYTKTDPQSDSIRRDYVSHIARMLSISGMSPSAAQEAAQRVMRLETRLAKASMTIVEQRDPKAIYHKMSVSHLQSVAPSVNWQSYFSAMGLDTLTAPGARLDVSQPAFYRYLSHALTEVPLSDWRAYLRWQLLNATGFLLGNRFINEDFHFDQRLEGTKELAPRWKRCVNRTDRALGEALGQLYVAKEFSPAARARMIELVNNLQAVFRSRIEALDWMSAETKQRALVKLAAFTKKIGYPDRWLDYTSLEIAPDVPFVTNWLAARAFETRRQLAKIGKPKDKNEWTMTPPTVNAYYEPLNNEIVFPAGILMPPFFDPAAEDAVNYGGIGMTIGHEMTHGFDDEGRQYDASGNLRDWWTTSDAKGFNERAHTVVAQYSAYAPMTGLHINGQQTLGENLADIGGLTLAYYAYERSLEGKPRKVIDGFTPEQRFFLGAAQAWHSAYRPELLRLLVLTDVHSPDEWRVNGTVSAMPEFATAFGCRPKDPMVRSDAARARIW